MPAASKLTLIRNSQDMSTMLISAVVRAVPLACVLTALISAGTPTSGGPERVTMAPGFAPEKTTPATEPQQSLTVLETLEARGNFSILLEALEASGLSTELTNGEPLTLFAPTDAALSRLPAETRLALGQPENGAELIRLLRYHTASGRWLLADIGQRASVVTREGGELRMRQLDDGSYGIDVARLVETDIPCSDGVIHVIDGLLLPPGLSLVSDEQLFGGGVHQYTVDPGHSTVMFRVIHMDVGATYGWFERFSGELVVDADDPSNSSVLLAVEVASIDTKIKARDDYLQTEDFFHASKHPALTFRSTKVAPLESGALSIEGELSLRGVVRTVTFEAIALGQGRFGPSTYKVGFEAELIIRRSDFGMTYGIPGVAADEVRLTIALEADRPLDD